MPPAKGGPRKLAPFARTTSGGIDGMSTLDYHRSDVSRPSPLLFEQQLEADTVIYIRL